MPTHVSILIAVRNEEFTILRCLEALAELTYPADCLQILIGNDDSTDQTAQIIEQFRVGKPHFELQHIHTKVGTQAGKGNVLAQLAQRATGTHWLITDADIAVSHSWVEAVLETFANSTQNIGVASHFTWIEATDVFSACQALEWSLALGTFALLGQFGIGLTAQGNNMAVKREAYQATGGYENLPFHITEDFVLFWEIIKQGYAFKNVAHTKGLVTSLPAPTWEALFKQHRRWLVGALELSWFWRVMLWGRAFLLPMLLLLSLTLPTFAVAVGAITALSNLLTLSVTLFRVGKAGYLRYFPFFVFYQEIVLLGTVFYYFRQRQVEWKGRKY